MVTKTEQNDEPTLRTERRELSSSDFDGSVSSSKSDFRWAPIQWSIPNNRLQRFQIIREVGRGGFGIVYLARDERLNRHVAIKVIRPELTLDSKAIERFQREAQSAAILAHPGIVPVYESGVEEECHFYVMPFLDCPNLMDWMRARTHPVDEKTATLILIDIAKAVRYGHQQGIVHRDIKPHNILMHPTAESTYGYQPLLLDFGLSQMTDSLESTTNAVMGTPMYMAPEQASYKSRWVTPQSDIYSMGVVLYQLLTNHLPHQATTISEVVATLSTATIEPPRKWRPSLSPSLENICLKCLRKDPERRYAKVAELEEDLQHHLAGRPISARPAGIWERLDFEIRFNGWIPKLGLAVIAMNAVNAIWTLSGTILLRYLLKDSATIQEGFWPAMRFLLFVASWMHAFGIYCGWLMVRESKRYLVLAGGAMFSFVWDVQMWRTLFFEAAAGEFDNLTFLHFYAGSPMARVLVFLLIALGFGVQSLLLGLGAWASYRRAVLENRMLVTPVKL